MWTPTARRQHSRDGLRYETDLTDAEWALLEPLLPEPHGRGRPREWPLREVLKAIFYVLRGGVTWRLLPSDLSTPDDRVPFGLDQPQPAMVDTDGRGLILEPQPADVQDRDGAPLILRLSRRSFPFIAKAFADMGFAGDGPANATSIIIEIVEEERATGRKSVSIRFQVRWRGGGCKW